MRHGVKSLRESWCRAECAPGRTQDERGPPKAMAVAQLFAPEIGRTPFRGARKMATLRPVRRAVYTPILKTHRVAAPTTHGTWDTDRPPILGIVGRDSGQIQLNLEKQCAIGSGAAGLGRNPERNDHQH